MTIEPDQSGQYLPIAKILAAFAVLTLAMAGWLFTLIVGSQQSIRDSLENLRERVARLETQVEHLNRIADRYEHRQFEREQSKQRKEQK